MRTHNRVWLGLIAAGWALVLLSAVVTGGFRHSPEWYDQQLWVTTR